MRIFELQPGDELFLPHGVWLVVQRIDGDAVSMRLPLPIVARLECLPPPADGDLPRLTAAAPHARVERR